MPGKRNKADKICIELIYESVTKGSSIASDHHKNNVRQCTLMSVCSAEGSKAKTTEAEFNTMNE